MRGRGGLARSLIVKTIKSGIGDQLAHGEGSKAIHGVTNLGAWPLQEHPCEGLQRGLGGSKELLDTSIKIPTSLNGSLHICIALYLLLLLYILRLCV